MVTQANTGTVYDFFKDPIRPILEDGWLIAKDTTLGADNGIGVALALAVLDSNDIAHGPIEVLLTVDEEAGMSGARLLQAGVLKGKWLFNIDTEEWGELYLGCAGSIDVEMEQPLNYEKIPENLSVVNIQVAGLKGGHSGVDIHLGRGNANVILARFLNQHLQQLGGRLVEFSGGSARNALPREAVATIAISPNQLPELEKLLAEYQTTWKKQLQGIDDNLQLTIQPNSSEVTEVIALQQQGEWLQALATSPYGVASMSQALPDVVETSNNIGVVKLSREGGKAVLMVRSMVNQEAEDFAKKIQAHFSQFNIASTLTPLVQKAFNIEPKLKVIHAGLECGIIAEHYPDLQMVSFGPDIQGAHAPGERVKVDTVDNCWKLLVTALASVE
jgi:dipeptidase D